MKERPILFSAPMVRALLNGTKTQTRRVFKQKNGGIWPNLNDLPGMRQILRNCPYGQPGDRLWVRETWARDDEDGGLCYRADIGKGGDADDWERNRLDGAPRFRWRPSIHMPRWASRITLEITKVRVERLQDISEDDALAEGCSSTAIVHEDGEDYTGHYASEEYQDLWESINGPGSWDANPWVWAVSFKRLEQPA